MPLADHARVIATRLQMLGHIVAIAVDAIEDGHAIEMRILPREQCRAAGSADRVGNKAVREPRTCFGETIQMRRLVHFRAIRRDRMLGMVVGEDEDNVGPVSRNQNLTALKNGEGENSDE